MSEEDKYIKQSETDQIGRIRRERQLAALRQEERDGIAAVLHTTEEIAAEALDLGFDRETARILHLIPVIQVAWADDKIQEEERSQILTMASERGVVPDGHAYDFLELLLTQRPSSLFFERTNKVIAHLVSGSAHDADDLLAQAQAVAGAAGGFFGLGSKVSPEEQALLADLAAMFQK